VAETAEPGPDQKDLDQLDSFIEQDLHEDAIRLLGQLESDFPEHPTVTERRTELKAKGVLLEEVVGVPVSGPEQLFADEEESFVDLAKELEEELAEEEAMVEEATGKGQEEAILEEVFREFQKGVEEQLSEEDSDTHFNLGIAYKEMGLLPEAIREFQVASRNSDLFVECCSMIGMCFMEQGMWSQAAEWYQKALEAPDLTPEAELALRYDLAASLESAGEVDRAVGLYQEVVDLNPSYRDVSVRLDALSGG
jgi:tetratricopeptide (TPR) repeat protein